MLTKHWLLLVGFSYSQPSLQTPHSSAARVSILQGWVLSSVGRVLSLIPSTTQTKHGGELVIPALRKWRQEVLDTHG